ncbi:S1 family peptidase [Aureimonas ureilytica]|uniref:S1 family peptidase n=1 Tax=Aureimonas ureilytica TaxID=401562 RepID=UPI00035C2E18|nr:trypsin-like serine protease [Aureimonas ureilytica]
MTAEEEVVYVEPFSPAVTILITAALNGSDKGGCCNTAQRIENFIDISAERAPVLSSAAAMAKGLSPFMINGEQTQGYRSVGSIGLRGEIHCTGTLVAPKTIITAAHCMFGLNSEIEQGALDFRIGDTFRSATLVFKIVKAELPDSQADGFVFDPNNYEDDLAVAYLDEVPPVDPTPLYEGSPPWKDIIASGKRVLMVGFGFNGITESNGHFSLFAPGIKRQAEIPIDNVTNRKIYFGANVQENTCRGDSGGPTLLEGTSPRGATLAIVAVTSGGSGVNCSDGINLRLDAYRSWLQTRLL